MGDGLDVGRCGEMWGDLARWYTRGVEENTFESGECRMEYSTCDDLTLLAENEGGGWRVAGETWRDLLRSGAVDEMR